MIICICNFTLGPSVVIISYLMGANLYIPKCTLVTIITTIGMMLLLVVPGCWATDERYCPEDYFFDTQHCQKCTPHCKCTSEGTCSSCIDGYTLYGSTCIQCPQSSGLYGTCSGCCSRTSGTILSCTDCTKVANYYSFLFSGRCILSQGCFEVDQNGYCLVCRSGYYTQNNLCHSCHTSCSTCVDLDNCVTCADGYYWKVANYGLCTGCPTGCSTCTNDTICTSCLDSYYFYQDHCLQCPTNCQICVDGSTCIKCSSGILVTNLCISCTDTTYSGSAGCLSCYESNNFIKCSACDDIYFLDATNGVCRLCEAYITGAARCRDQNTPIQCKNDYDPILTNRYYLVGISCVANTKSCKKIGDIYGNCSTCYPDYTLTLGACVSCTYTGCVVTARSVVSNVCTCTQCDRGYYLTAPTCTPCTTLNCAVCASDVCSACMTGYYFSGGSCLVASVTNCLQSKSGSATLCSICNDGYFLGTDQLCYRCQQNCLKCTNRLTCTSCDINTKLSNGYCLTYPSNCAEVAVSGTSLTCILCNYGFFLEGGFCVACSVELGTLSRCDGLCPIDYYIKNLILEVTDFQIRNAVHFGMAFIILFAIGM